jgi:hypothetical protein
MKSDAVLEIMKENFKSVPMNLSIDDWRDAIPKEPGWYKIESDAPPEIFKRVESPNRQFIQRHYDIPKKVSESLVLAKYGACILPTDINPSYVVIWGKQRT